MKKIILLILPTIIAFAVNAQNINTDTLAKYSKKVEQLKLLDQIATDIHLDQVQKQTFNQVSTLYANQALVVLNRKDSGRLELLKALKEIGGNYMAKLKTFLSDDQIDNLKIEREKYQFLRRFTAPKIR